MRKLLNDPFDAVDEMLDGILIANGEVLRRTPRGRGLHLRAPTPGRRVAIVVGGGSGHEPSFYGMIGPGLADGCAVGNVFASPAATPAVELGRILGRDSGVLFLFGNYEGDIMNFSMAADLLADDGVFARWFAVTDDVLSAAEPRARRGVAGAVVVLKATGAAADAGASLDEVVAVATRANDRVRSAGVGLGPCIVPTAGRATFDLPEGEMDIGMGVHGEAGQRRAPLRRADAVADELLDAILKDRPPQEGERLLLVVNTLGATPLMEGHIVLRRIARRLAEIGLKLHRAVVGEYVTSLEMSGLSISVAFLDKELRELVDAPARAVALPALGSWR